ncbi:MAG: hypothetical protein J6Q62_00105 [Alistipes sp.]|nr:hypothetical protein [Alistipes sp.]
MKRIFTFVMALCLTSIATVSATAQQNDAEFSKEEIRAIVAEFFEDQMSNALEMRPFKIVVDLLSFYDGLNSLDEKSMSYALKQMDVWKRKNSDRYLLFRDYIITSIGVLAQEDFEGLDPRAVCYIYLDAVAELYDDYQDSEGAAEMFTNYMIYMRSHSLVDDGKKYAEDWTKASPEEAEAVSKVSGAYDEEVIMRVLGSHFDENLLAMTRDEKADSYIRHLEGMADSYERGDNMEMYRHYLALLSIVESIVDGEEEEYIDSVLEKWESENHERAEIVSELLNQISGIE